MQRTITAAFDSRDAAERAAEALVFRFGIARADVHDQATDEALWGSLGRHHIPDADRHLFAEAVSRGAAIVSASVDEAHLEPAMDLLESHGAWDLDEREQGWRSAGWTGFSTYGGDAVIGPENGPALGERGNMHDARANPPGTLLSRGADDALGTNMSGARPQHDGAGTRGTGRDASDLDAALIPGDQGEPGTMLSRGIDDALGTNLSGARPEHETGPEAGRMSDGRAGFGSDHSAAADGSAAVTPGERGMGMSPGNRDAVGTGQSGAPTGRATDDDAIPVVEERLQVGKREVTHGRVRVRTYVVETPVEEQVRLRQEHVRVERQPVDRPVTDADRLFAERTVEATETAEEAVVAKEARVTEELRLQKDATERTETVRDTVRRTEVEVENDVSPTAPLPPGSVAGTDPTRRNI